MRSCTRIKVEEWTEEWSREQQKDADMDKSASRSGIAAEDLPKRKGAGKQSGKKRDAADIHADASKPKKKKNIPDDDEDDHIGSRPLGALVTQRRIAYQTKNMTYNGHEAGVKADKANNHQSHCKNQHDLTGNIN